MFGVDDFAVWFTWYFVSNMATQHPSAQNMAERAQTAIIGEARPAPAADDPQRLLDWLVAPSVPKPAASTAAASTAAVVTLSP